MIIRHEKNLAESPLFVALTKCLGPAYSVAPPWGSQRKSSQIMAFYGVVKFEVSLIFFLILPEMIFNEADNC